MFLSHRLFVVPPHVGIAKRYHELGQRQKWYTRRRHRSRMVLTIKTDGKYNHGKRFEKNQVKTVK